MLTRPWVWFAPLFVWAALPATSVDARERAEHYQLTLVSAQQLARKRAPAIAVAGARIHTARGKLAAASVLQKHNPQLSVGFGPRFSSEPTTLDFDAMLLQRIELGGQRGAKIASARAGIEISRAMRDRASRRILYDVSRAFLGVLHAQAALVVATDSAGLAKQLLEVAQKRHAAGDVGVLDVNVAHAAQARAHVNVARLRARHTRSMGTLRALLGLAPRVRVTVSGDLTTRRRYQLESLLRSALERPLLKIYAAQLQQARARVDLGRRSRWPDIGVFARYGHEEGHVHKLTGGLQFFVPVFSRGQGQRALGGARERTLRLQLRVARRQLRTDVHTAYRTYQQLDRAARSFGSQALPRLSSNARLAQRSYRSGALPIAQLLPLQRESVSARMSYTTLLFEAALAALDIEAKAGILK